MTDKSVMFIEVSSFVMMMFFDTNIIFTLSVSRIIISPQPTIINDCSADHLSNILSKTELMHIITRIFYGQSDVYSSIHMLLSQAAENIICSPEFPFQSCLYSMSRESEELSTGFSNPIERGYVTLIIFLGTLSVVLTIVIICIFREGDIMRKERQRENPLISDNDDVINNVNTNSASDEDPIPFQNENATDRRRFYQARKNRRFRNRSSVKDPGTAKRRDRPSVTYSEVSIHQ